MPNPRDFLPARYKKNQVDHSVQRDIIPDSPWSNLAKEPKIPEYRTSTESTQESGFNSHDSSTNPSLDNKFENNDHKNIINQSNNSSVKKTSIPKKTNSKLAGLLVVLFLVIGVFSSYLLSQQSQDNRQQASGICVNGDPYCVCDHQGSTLECHLVTPTATETPTATPIPTMQDCPSGYIDQGNGCEPKVYNTYPTPTNGVCPSGYQLSTGQCIPKGSLAVPQPDPVTHNCGTGWQYNASTDKCQLVCPSGQIACPDNSCHITGVGAPNPCEPTGLTACGEVTEPGPGENCNTQGQVCHEYRVEQRWCSDCATSTNCHWQYLYSNYQCNNSDSCNSDNPTVPTTTATQPPTVTTTAPSPICSDIEMLDQTGETMTADDDKSLKNGDQVKFRATATNISGLDITYEFRIWAPNMSSWTDITNADTSSGAANVSAAYTIVSSGHHVVQSRICISGTCQAWETVTGAPNDTNQ